MEANFQSIEIINNDEKSLILPAIDQNKRSAWGKSIEANDI